MGFLNLLTSFQTRQESIWRRKETHAKKAKQKLSNASHNLNTESNSVEFTISDEEPSMKL